jgi:hypothetical protein
MEALGVKQVDMILELRKRGITVQPPEMSSIIRGVYEKADLKPTVAGMAIALNGMSRQTLTAIAHDRPTGSAGYKTALPREVADSIKKAYKMLENMWETYMNSGKINPVSGIFLGKNNYGYQDKTEYVLTPNQQNDSDYDAEDIRQRYLIDSDSDSQSD